MKKCENLSLSFSLAENLQKSSSYKKNDLSHFVNLNISKVCYKIPFGQYIRKVFMLFYLCIMSHNYGAFSHDVTAAILVFQNDEIAVMLVYQANAVGVELLSYANDFFCSNKFA